MSRSVFIANGTVVSHEGRARADILVRDGRIAAIGPDLDKPAGIETVDAEGLHILPGVIDPHSHFWEAGFAAGPDFADSSASAVAGGITTSIDMPLTEPVVIDAASLRAKAALGERTSHVDFALYGGVTPDNRDALAGMWEAGAAALKIFTCDTGSIMAGVIDDGDLAAAMATIAGFGGLAAFHAEDAPLLASNLAAIVQSGKAGNDRFALWHDEAAELAALRRILGHAAALGTRVHIVHVTSPRGVALIDAAAAAGLDASGETCPHYLYLTDADIAARGAWLACAPPMRERAALEGLRLAIAKGGILTIGSDHCPVDPANKRLPLLDAQPGLPGNETLVPLMLNLVAECALTLERMVELTSLAPARRYGLLPRKGTLSIASDADFTLVDIDRRWTIDGAKLAGRAGWTPFEGLPIRGAVAMTIIRGRVAAMNGRSVGSPGEAQFIARNPLSLRRRSRPRSPVAGPNSRSFP